MRKVFVSDAVRNKIIDIRDYLVIELNLSEDAAYKRIERMREFISSFSSPVNYPLCRFKRWHELKYRCAVFEKTWVFAYEIFENGIIVRDLAHTTILMECNHPVNPI